jgi:hypothetical protein
MIQNFPQIITLILILLYIPCVCYSDWKTRTFEFMYFLPLAIWGLFTTVLYLEESPARNFWLMGLTLIMCVFFLIPALLPTWLKGWGGADFWFVSFILVFLQFNPFITPRLFFPLDFFLVLIAVMGCLPLAVYAYNWLEYHPPKTLYGKFFYFPDGMPFMLPISFAFLVTLILEMIL